MEKLRVAVLGSTGIVGQQFVRMLQDHPFFEIVSLTASKRAEGKKYREYVDWNVRGDVPRTMGDMVLDALDVDVLKKKEIDLAFSALPTKVAGEVEEKIAEEGIYVFSNARPHRLDKTVPILIPEINESHIDLVDYQEFDDSFIITNSNCSTAGLVFGIEPLSGYDIGSVQVVTYQSLSGAGLKGVPSMAIQGNVLPYIGGEESSMEAESGKILGRFSEDGRIVDYDRPLYASCARVAVRDGHLENVSIRLDEDLDLGEVKRALKTFEGAPQEMELPTAPKSPIVVREEENRPQPVKDVYAGKPERAEGMSVSIGRIMKKSERMINMWLLVHNTIRGAAGTSILNAEYAFETGRIER